MSCVNSVALFLVFKCVIEIRGVFWARLMLWWGLWDVTGKVGRPKKLSVRLVGDGKLVGKERGQAGSAQTKAFDSTMGFPGEDVAPQLQ